MFPPCFYIGRSLSGQPHAGTAGRPAGRSAIPRLIVLVTLLAAALPAGVSAQALGTMQVRARVLPGRPGWVGLSEARSLARDVLLAPSSASDTRRSGLVLTRAELTAAAGRRRLLVTVDYPRN
jgi:hypothetical protein